MTREETINFLRKKIEKNPKSILFARLADYYLKQKRIKEALELCTKGCEYNPDYITGNYILAKIYLTMGDHEKAETQFKKVISHDRYFLSAHKHLGDMMAKIGWENKAINHYKDILKLDPMEQEAFQMLETFSLEENSDETETFEHTFPTTEDTNEFEESSQKEDIKSTEIDQELRKVFDEENIPEGTSQKDIELEEVTSEDESSSEEKKGSEPENLKFELPDDLKENENMEYQTPAETTEEKEKSDEPQKPVSGSEDGRSDSWILPENMEEETQIEKTEKKETQNLEDLQISKPTEPEPKDSQLENETVSDEKIDEKEHALGTYTADNIEKTEEIEEEKSVPETHPEHEEYEKTLSEKHDTDENSEQEETAQTLEGSHADSIPKEDKNEVPEQPEEIKKDITAQEKEKKQSKSGEEDNLVTPTLGEIYIAQGQFGKALDVYNKLLEKNPDNKEYKKKIKELKQKQ